MPFQSRGFWQCGRCERLFDDFHEATFHESSECRLPMAAAPRPRQGPRVLWASSPHPAGLTEHDALTVRNLEAFAVDHPDAMDGYGNRLTMGLVGIRCVNCAGEAAAARSVVFPRSLSELGDCIRDLAEWHVGTCRGAPPNVRQVLEGALQRRHKAKAEGGAMWYQEEGDRRTLLEYCGARCQELRLVEIYPPRTGIMFSYYGGEISARRHAPNEGMPFPEEAKQASRPTAQGAILDESFDPAVLPFDDDLNPELFGMVPADRGTEGPGFETMPTNFPFFREPSGDWICKFCQHLHPQFRDTQYRWAASNRNPPPAHFIDFHLKLCSMYQQSLLQDFRGAPNPVAIPALLRSGVPSEASRAATAVASLGRGKTGQPSGGEAASSVTPSARAIEFLEANDLSTVDEDGTPLPPEANLVVEEDRLLLTDYFYYLFKQLRLCRFAESDRKTRGGKRQTITIGYGGLQCVHCAGHSNPRKFFWASVDRIANSFAEMPNHILKCRQCPPPTRDALLTLKESHAGQMTRLPRGSQKVFLRRMWRRLHKHDPKAPPPSISTASGTPRPSKKAKKETTGNSPGTSGSDGSVVIVERSPEEAAKALVYSAIQTGPPSPSSRVLLATPDDTQWLSDHDCFVRKQIEVFCATREDVDLSIASKKAVVYEGQVGIRCIHCALSKRGNVDGGGVYYPFSISAMYDAVREFQRLHLDSCPNLHPDARARLENLKGASSLSSVLRNYFQMAAKGIGLVDTKDGIRATGQCVPLQSQEFTFSDRIPKALSRAVTASEGKTPKQEAEDDSKPSAV